MKSTLWIIGGLVAAFFLLGAVVRANDPLTGEKDSARRAIGYCDQGAKDELQPAGQRLFIRNTCDGMRNEYRTKYNSSP